VPQVLGAEARAHAPLSSLRPVCTQDGSARPRVCSALSSLTLLADHHCPWLGSRCIGHRTYPAFVHFIGCISALALYIAIISGSAVWYSFQNPSEIVSISRCLVCDRSCQLQEETLAIHELLLTAIGTVFSIVVGSFFLYHLYLIS
jgi:hypothetical protein